MALIVERLAILHFPVYFLSQNDKQRNKEVQGRQRSRYHVQNENKYISYTHNTILLYIQLFSYYILECKEVTLSLHPEHVCSVR